MQRIITRKKIMFGLGTGELIIIFIVALLIFGPKRLPALARNLAEALKTFRSASRDLQEQLKLEETNLEEPETTPAKTATDKEAEINEKKPPDHPYPSQG